MHIKRVEVAWNNTFRKNNQFTLVSEC